MKLDLCTLFKHLIIILGLQFSHNLLSNFQLYLFVINLFNLSFQNFSSEVDFNCANKIDYKIQIIKFKLKNSNYKIQIKKFKL